jgi:hypothetical protein
VIGLRERHVPGEVPTCFRAEAESFEIKVFMEAPEIMGNSRKTLNKSIQERSFTL